MQISPAAAQLLISCVQKSPLDFSALLVIQQTEIIGILPHHREGAKRIGKPIANGDPLEASKEALVVLGLAEYLLADSRRILAAVALAEHKQRMLPFDS